MISAWRSGNLSDYKLDGYWFDSYSGEFVILAGESNTIQDYRTQNSHLGSPLCPAVCGIQREADFLMKKLLY